MTPWLQRLLTVAAGVGIGIVGVVVPATAAFTIPAAIGLVGWAVPHPADNKGKTE